MSSNILPIIKKLPEDVVNRIAAGEVIQRPSNALKELLENSLDAHSTNIQITVKNGGIKLLQIQDNGTGIRKEDFPIVCERFTTSKLKAFDDLLNIATYGFRGEALASISHVAHVTITSKTQNDVCAYQASFVDGKLEGKIKPLAGNQGTIITVEDLFYNLTIRKNSFKPNEEYQRISDVVSKYAVHNASVGFSLKKQGSSNDVKTPIDSNVVDNIRVIYGNNIARELVEFDFENKGLEYKAKGHFTNVNYSTKKMHFLLFVNNRLVDCSKLKRSIDLIFENYLPKHQHPFVYLSLEINPHNLDVNCHPTKHEVIFLNQEQILEELVTELEKKMICSNNSRTFHIQTFLPKINFESEPDIKSNGKNVHPRNLVRTDHKLQKLDKFINVTFKEKSDKQKNDVSISDDDIKMQHEEFMKKNDNFESELMQKTDDNIVVDNIQCENNKNINESFEIIEDIKTKCFSTPIKEKSEHKNEICNKKIQKSSSDEANFCMPSTSKIISHNNIEKKCSENDMFENNDIIEKNDISMEKLYLDDIVDNTNLQETIANIENTEIETKIIEDTEIIHKAKKPKLDRNLTKGKQIDKPIDKNFIAKVTKVPTKLTSVLELRKHVEDSCHHQLRETFAQHVFVGPVTTKLALIQHSTKLLLCDTEKILSELFYQFVLYNFQNFDKYEFPEPISLKELALICLDQKESGWTQEDGSKNELAQRVSEILIEKSPMLLDYFSITIDNDGNISTLPILLENHIPNPSGLPMYITRLATEVNWQEEKPCFESFARETGKYYANICDEIDDNGKDWKWITEFVLYPAIKNYLIPPKSFLENNAIHEATNLPSLYKVFERC